MGKRTGYRYSIVYMAAFGLLALCLLFFTGTTVRAGAGEKEALLEEIDRTMNGIIDWQCEQYGADSMQELLSGGYAQNAGSGVVQSYIFGLRGRGEAYDYTDYIAALQELLLSPEKMSPSSLQKSAMIFEALDAENPAEEVCLNETIGKNGIMTYIYGLLMLHGGRAKSDAITVEEIIAVLLDLQLPDGGFAVSGESGDVDVTAMAVQALAPYYLMGDGENGGGLSASVEQALAFLSEKQLPGGDFESYGNANAESTAQVILALCALGKDPLTEEAFIKNGNTVYEGLMKYRSEDGSFLHTLDGRPNDMATSQAFYALAAVYRCESGKCFLFDFTGYEPMEQPEKQDTDRGSGKDDPTVCRIILTALLIVVTAIYLAAMLIRKKCSLKRILGTGFVLLLLLCGIWLTDIQTVEEYRRDSVLPESDEQMEVTLEIRCDTVAGETDRIPADGTILAETDFSVPEGTTVFELLKEAARLYDIQVEYEGNTVYGLAYVEGIAYLYEFDFGDLSGWMYQVNGVFPSVGCGEYELSDQDRVLWVYTRNIGKDVESYGQD